MIQRQQSLWLLLSILSGFLSYGLPFYSGTRIAMEKEVAANLNAGTTFPLMALTGISIILAVIALFLYKNRKTQFRLCVVGALLSALIIVFFFLEKKQFLSGSVSISAIFVFAMLIGFIMAARGIWKDQKLVKSLDKLR
jgi:hypothetical protein